MRPNNRTVEHCPLPHLTTLLLEAYLQQFLSPHTSCPAVQKKITRHTRRQKTQSEETEQVLDQTQQECWNYETRNLKQL